MGHEGRIIFKGTTVTLQLVPMYSFFGGRMIEMNRLQMAGPCGPSRSMHLEADREHGDCGDLQSTRSLSFKTTDRC